MREKAWCIPLGKKCVRYCKTRKDPKDDVDQLQQQFPCRFQEH